MNKQIVLPVSIAAIAFVAGGIMLSSLNVSANEVEVAEQRGMHRQMHNLSDEQLAQKDQMQSIKADVLGVSVEELEQAHENHTMRELVTNAGYDEPSEFREAIQAAAEAAGIELPDRGAFGGPHNRGMHR